ncbi:MAG: hypothetical protein PHX43_07235 [Alphaproteobacteria bacterium]|nr:hypothetical protein [Alphaproteobacteria bacterium]
MLVFNVLGAKNNFATHQRMASQISEIIRERGFCNPSDLECANFSRAEIARCWPMAHGLAQVELNWLEA